MKALTLIKIDLNFLCKCKDSDVIPKFLYFRLVNKKVEDSLTYKNYRRNLLVTKINLKKSRLRVLKKEFYLLHSELKCFKLH